MRSATSPFYIQAGEGNELRSRLFSERHIVDGVRLGSGVLVLQKDVELSSHSI